MYHAELRRNKDNKSFVKNFSSPYLAHKYLNRVRHGKALTIISVWCDDPYANISEI